MATTGKMDGVPYADASIRPTRLASSVLSRLWEGRSFVGGLLAIGLGWLGQQAVLGGDGTLAWRYYGAAFVVLILSLLHPALSWRRRTDGEARSPSEAGRRDPNEALPAEVTDVQEPAAPQPSPPVPPLGGPAPGIASSLPVRRAGSRNYEQPLAMATGGVSAALPTRSAWVPDTLTAGPVRARGARRAVVAPALLAAGENAGPWSRWEALRSRLGLWVTLPGLALTVAMAAASAFILSKDITDPLGGWLWAGSLAMLLLTFLGVQGWPRGEGLLPRPESDFFGRGIPTIPIRWEIVLAAALMITALLLRINNLEFHPGIFGDEGEQGMDVRAIIQGAPSPIFGTGWWQVPNLSFYVWQFTLRVFGDNMVGLRMFSVLFGVSSVWFIYRLGRLLWGPRAGLLAGFMLAISPLALQFSRFANVSSGTAALWAIGGFYFFMALRYRRWSDWILAGFFWSINLYFYPAGKLIIPLVAALGAYCLVRWRMEFFKRYALGFVLLGFVFALTFMPSGVEAIKEGWTSFVSRAQETSIFSPGNQAPTFARYGIPYDPTWASQSMVTNIESNPMPWVQLVFQQSRETFDVLYRRGDQMSYYKIEEHGGSVFQPFWAVLALLGLGYALWKFWDARYALPLIWFVFGLLGSILTVDTPNLQRFSGAWTVVMLFPAVLLDRVFAGAWPINMALAKRWAVVPLAAIIVYLGADSYQEYFTHYYSLCPFCRDTVQARFVQALGQDYKGYELGVGDYDIYFGYGSTRFAAKGVEGTDLFVPADAMPITDNNGKGAAFIVWQNNIQYLKLIEQFYPGGVQNEEKSHDGVTQFISYKLTKEQLAAFQTVHASYAPQQGSPVNRDEPNLGSTGSSAPWQPPAGVSFPATATWQGGLVAPTYGSYAFQLTGSGAKLDIDGKTVIDGNKQAGAGNAPLGVQLVLAKGIHDVRLTGTLADGNSRVDLLWGGKDAPLNPIDARYLYNGTTGGLSAERSNNVVPDALHAADPFAGQAIIDRRVDPFFGFREGVVDFGQSAFVARWQGTLSAPAAGSYTFDVSSSGSVVLRIDNQPVIDGQAGGGIGQGNGTVNLTAGPHTVDLRYAWNGGPARLEWYWTPPGGERAIVPPTVLTPLQRSWPIDQVPNVPPGAVQHQDEAPVKVAPDAVIGAGAGLSKSARGVGVDAQGNIYVGDQGNYRIVVFSPDGKVLRTWGKAAPDDNQKPPPGEFTLINDIAVQPNGTVYVLENTGVVQVFDSQGKLLRMMGPEDLGMYAPNGIDVGPDGSVYIADTGRNRVLKLSPTSNGLPTTDFVGDTANAGSIVHLNQPVDALVYQKDGKEQVFGVDIKNRIEQLGADGNMLKEWLLQVGILEGGSKLSISPDGSHIYMSDTDRARVAVLNLSDGSVIFFGGKGSDPGMFGSPSGIATGPDGRVYVLDRANGNVQVFKPPTK